MSRVVRALVLSLGLLIAGLGAAPASAQDAASAPTDPQPSTTIVAGPAITISMPETERPRASSGLQILFLLTILSVAPGLLISMTSFTRIVVVLSFVRQALGTQNAPPTQVILALSLLLTFVVMAPVGARIHERALTPYLDDAMSEEHALQLAKEEISTFLLRQTREDDLLLFYDLSHLDRPAGPEDVSIHLLVPAFMLSELRTGFEMGFLLFLPFVLIDLIAGSILTSMGMVMMPPTMISTPVKLLLFVLVDGWSLLVRALVASFG